MQGNKAKITAFCCIHSGYRALEKSKELELEVPEGVDFVQLPCSGKLEGVHVLKAFETGAEGAIVFGCQDDACAYIRGNKRAKQCVSRIQDILDETGVERNRLRFCAVASNMPHRFIKLLKEMIDDIGKLGESKGKME